MTPTITSTSAISTCSATLSDRFLRLQRERCIDDIRRCATCITWAVWIASPLDEAAIWRVRLAADRTRLPTAPDLTLRAILDFHVRQRSQSESPSIRPVSYRYELRDRNGEKIFAYHFHPTGLSHVTTPHPHVSGGSRTVRLDKRHLVPGVVTFPDIIRHLITEFDVPPLRPDWRDILTSQTGTIRTAIQD